MSYKLCLFVTKTKPSHGLSLKSVVLSPFQPTGQGHGVLGTQIQASAPGGHCQLAQGQDQHLAAPRTARALQLQNTGVSSCLSSRAPVLLGASRVVSAGWGLCRELAEA